MPGFWSGLTHAASRGAVGISEGRDEAEKALLERQARLERQKVQDASVRNLTAEAATREYALAHPTTPAWHPSSKQDYIDTHPTKDTGPVPGSEEWYSMQERVAKLRAKYRASAQARPGALGPLDRAITATGQDIAQNRSNLGVVDRQIKGYANKEVTDRRNVDPRDVGQFVTDSSEFAGLQGQRRALATRGDSLVRARDSQEGERNKNLNLSLGMSPTSPTAGAGGSGGGQPKTGLPLEAQTAFKEAALAYQADPTPENQAKYNRIVAAISRKYHLTK